MKLSRKLLCLLLALAMVLTLTPAVARAEEVVSEPETDQVEATVPAEEPDEEIPEAGPVTVEIPFQINPRYEGLITEADLDIPEFPEKDPNQVQPQATTYLSIQDAGVQMRKQMKNRTGSFTIHVKSDSSDYQAVSDAVLTVALEHTGVATEGDYIAWQYGGCGGQVTYSQNSTTKLYEYSFDFVVPYYTTAAQEQQMNTAVNNLINSLGIRYKSDYDKIYGVYDWLCQNVTYDYENLEDNTYLLKHTAYAALIDKTAVCQGYAVLFYRLMLELGVDARVIVGDGGGPHAWNIVELDGLYYNLDSTWDAGQSEYIWFLNSTWDFAGHEREMQYDTIAFHNEYPMAAETYEAGKTATKDPYIYAGYCGTADNDYANAEWWLGRDGSLTIKGTGSTYNFNTSDQQPYYCYWIDEITKVIVEEGIQGIGDCSFYAFPNLKEVSFPDTLESIGSNAFYGCASLKEVKLPDSVTYVGSSAFENCTSLTDAVVSPGLKNCGKNIFKQCTALENVTLSSGLTEIPASMFVNCTALEQIVFPDSIEIIGSYAFSGCSNLENFELPENLKKMQDGCFAYCKGLTKVVVPEGTEYIGFAAFNSCKNLQEVVLPDSIKHLSGFMYCENLTDINMPSQVEVIGISAFEGCSKLGNMVLPDTLTEIQESGFKLCSGFTEIVIPSGVEKIGKEAFYGCTNVTKLELPDSIQTIGSSAFQYCRSITEFDFPSGLSVLENSVFANCRGLESVKIPDTIQKIKSYAFKGCTGLQEFILSDSVIVLDQGVFDGCTSLTSMTIPKNVVVIRQHCFNGCSSLKTIYFQGNAPSNHESITQYTNIFGNLVADVYYPADNATWSETARNSYGGTITWVPYSEVAEPTVKWSSISTSLGGNIAMNFYVELSQDLVTDPEAYIQFTFAGRTLKVALREGKESQKNGVTVYQFSCPITSKNMTDEITAQVYNGSGKVGEPKSMSVDTYCNWVIANFKDEKTVNLMKGMLNYGASAQKLFNYRTDDLANATLAEEDKVFGAVDASAYKHTVTGTEDGIIAKSMTLLLDSETTVRVYFELTGDKPIEEYTFTVDGVEVQPTFKDGKYYIERPNISAHRLDDMHVFTCGGITVTYGGLSYVNQVMTYYTEGATFEMASALYAYSKAAEAYIG